MESDAVAASAAAAQRRAAHGSGGAAALPENMEFRAPEQRLRMDSDVRVWEQTHTYRAFVAFLEAAGDSVRGVRCSAAPPPNAACDAVLRALDALSAAVDRFPPVDQTSRFGNKSYRDWFAAMQAGAAGVMDDVLPEHLRAASVELVEYWTSAFGNETRIDYGTGHEASFAVFLYCLHRLQLVSSPEHLRCAVLTVFARYLLLMRKLQTVYWLEPAGSHGVWGLDDYQHLAFLFGAAQLVENRDGIRPAAVNDDRAIAEHAGEYLYLAAVQFIKKVKSGPIAVTSPMLSDISAVPQGWPKIYAGLVKMYKGEVLAKRPVIQHLRFGALFPFA